MFYIFETSIGRVCFDSQKGAKATFLFQLSGNILSCGYYTKIFGPYVSNYSQIIIGALYNYFKWVRNSLSLLDEQIIWTLPKWESPSLPEILIRLK